MFSATPEIISDPVRIALVGCGRISLNHIKSIVKFSAQAKLVAFCDNKSERLENASKIFNEACLESSDSLESPAQYHSYESLIADIKSKKIEINLVVLTTPSGLHPKQAILAANAGVHVCTEKPMATRWTDGLEMVKACDNAGVYLFVVKQNRFNSTLQLVKKQISNLV